jgi:probable O-glycosylation ligase (exosortase A-associated)
VKGLILVYAIAALGSVGALASPIIGLFVYVGFAVLRPQFIWGWAGDFEGISFYVGIATLVGWLIHGCGSLKLGAGRSIVIALGIFVALFLLSTIQAVDTTVAYGEIYPLAKIFVPFIIGLTLIDTEESSRALLWIIVLAQGYVSFEMNLEYLFKSHNIAADGFGGMDNNCFGVSLVTTIGPALVLALGAKKWYEKAAAAICAALILHTTLLTFSRGAMVGMIAVGATAFAVMPKRPKYLAGLVVVGLIALRLTGPQLMARYATTTASEEDRDTSAESRVDLWRDCLNIGLQNPILGIGPGNFHVIAGSIGWTEGKQAHSTWMQAVAENGFPGAIALLMFFVIAALKLWPIARARQTELNRDQIVMASGIIMSIVGFIVTAQFVSLGGLEIPYYLTMIGVVMLRNNQVTAAAAPALRVVKGMPSGPRAPMRRPALARSGRR